MIETPITDLTRFDTESDAVEYYFNWYRSHGFPNIELANYDPMRELEKIIAFDETTIANNGMLNQTMHGCGFLWAFFPHWVDVRTWNDSSLADNWGDDEKLRALMRKTYRYCMKHQRGKWTTNRIRQNAKVYCSKQSPSNFRPTVAKYLYNAYGDCGTVYDPCGGWGGRLLGFLASNCERYIACEPSTKTAAGLEELKRLYSYVGKDIDIRCECAEDYTPKPGSFDMAFTSPPYFDNEHYSDEPTQSYIKFSDYDSWLNGFLRGMVENCHTGLKDNAYLLLNVANTTHAPTLERDTVKTAIECGFIHVDTLYLMLSSIAGKGYKTEPIFVFEKVPK